MHTVVLSHSGLAAMSGLIATGSLSLLCVWSILHTCHKGVSYIRQLHQIPCCKCQYFTNDYRLKCPVRPTEACTHAAIDCQDFAADLPKNKPSNRPLFKDKNRSIIG